MINIIKRSPLVYIASIILLIAIITSATTFGGTFAWFVRVIDGVDVNGQMGTVKIDITTITPNADNSFTATIENGSDIDILVRVRVIVEPKIPNAGVPEGFIYTPDTHPLLIRGNPDKSAGWVEMVGLDGIFFVYGDIHNEGYELYNPVKPDDELTFTYKVPYGIPGDFTVTLIAEAIQATRNTYNYTTTSTLPGVTSWALN